MCTRSIEYDGIKYIEIINDKELKLKSLEDNLYCKLNDIYFNIDNLDFIEEADYFNIVLTNGITFPERNSLFKYSNLINNKLYLREIIRFLKNISEYDFYFDKLPIYDLLDLEEYIQFDIWYQELKDIISLLELKLKDIL